MSRSPVGLVVFYPKPNRYGLAAVAGALGTDARLASLPLAFVRRPAELPAAIDAALGEAGRVLLLLSYFTVQAPSMARLLRGISASSRERLVVVAGGPHPSGDPAGAIAAGCDVVVVGEGEETFRELVATLLDGGPPEEVAGLALPGGSGIRLTGRRPFLDLDDWPPWCAPHRKFGPIEISRGCPHGCCFCQTTYLFGGRVRHRSPKVVAAHAAVMAARGMPDVRFISPDAFSYGSPDGRSMHPDRVGELLEEVRRVLPSNSRIYFGSFPSEIRPEHVTGEMLRLVRHFAANDNLVIGAQTGSARLLEACRRGHGVGDVTRAVELIRSFGYTCFVDFVFGLPGETDDDLDQTIVLMDTLVAMGAVIHAHTFMPLPGTPFADAPPGRLRHRLRERVRKLVAAGSLFGEWHRQERIRGSS